MTYELGIIGGMGPLATNVFYQYLIDHTSAHSDQEHINTIILSHASMPDRSASILSGQTQLFLQEMKADFELLRPLHLKAIAIPCNTSHYFYDTLCTFTDTPIINMVEESIKVCAQQGDKTIAVLATSGTLNSGVYERYAEQYGLSCVPIDDKDAEQLMAIIYAVKQENHRDFPQLLEMIDRYSAKGRVVLACTELSTIPVGNRPVIDALKVLGNEAIRKCRGNGQF